MVDDCFLLSQLTHLAKRRSDLFVSSLTMVFDHSGFAGHILVNLQEQAAQHNSFLQSQPFD
jgi:hypothetical protein